MKKTARELDFVLGKWVDEHRHRRLTETIEEEEMDFIHVMLSAMDKGKASLHEANTVIEATSLVRF